MVKDNRKTKANNIKMQIYIKRLNTLLKEKEIKIIDYSPTQLALVNKENDVLFVDTSLKTRFNNRNRNLEITDDMLKNDLIYLLKSYKESNSDQISKKDIENLLFRVASILNIKREIIDYSYINNNLEIYLGEEVLYNFNLKEKSILDLNTEELLDNLNLILYYLADSLETEYTALNLDKFKFKRVLKVSKDIIFLEKQIDLSTFNSFRDYCLQLKKESEFLKFKQLQNPESLIVLFNESRKNNFENYIYTLLKFEKFKFKPEIINASLVLNNLYFNISIDIKFSNSTLKFRTNLSISQTIDELKAEIVEFIKEKEEPK